MSTVLFDQFKLSPEIQHAIKDMGFEKATQIQAGAIPLMLDKKDIVGQSETGSGKTAAFAIPIVELVTAQILTPQALVMSPTRELAIQIASECQRLMVYKRGLRVLPVYGGQPIERQIDALRRGIHIVIGTPGRLIDHIERGTISLDKVKIVVLDEADEMLDMGFRDAIAKILETIPGKPQKAFFSATIPHEIRSLISKHMVDPQTVTVAKKTMTVDTIKQGYFDIDYRHKIDITCRLIDIHAVKRGIIFCNTKRMVDELVVQLQTRGYGVEGLHGDLAQRLRDRVMNSFRTGAIQLLIATDVAARGIDVNDIDVVINYDLPQDEEDYVHRIGRTARAGKEGAAFSIVCGRDIYKLKSIENYARVKITRMKTPTSDDAREVMAQQISEAVKKTIADGHLAPYIDIVGSICGEEHSAMDVAAALLKLHSPIPKPDPVLPRTYDRPVDRGYRDSRPPYRGSNRDIRPGAPTVYRSRDYGPSSGYKGRRDSEQEKARFTKGKPPGKSGPLDR